MNCYAKHNNQIKLSYFYIMRLIIVTTLFLIPLIGFASFPVENEIFQAISLDENLKLENDAEPLSSALWPEALVFIGIGGFLYLLYLGVKRLTLLFRENPRKFWIFLVTALLSYLLFYLLLSLFNPGGLGG
tara:strand:+ start:72 stop:464 length:393 start_codon:yes stop_codon:yes gene_type:complete